MEDGRQDRRGAAGRGQWLVGLPLALAAGAALAWLAPGLVRWFDDVRAETGSAAPASDAAAPASVRVAARGADTIRFGRDVRPLLSDRCFLCHGPDAAKRQADLRLDRRASAVDERGVIAPGDPGGSEVLRRISSTDPTVRMPPPDSTKAPLTPHEQALIAQWIAAGAEYEPHWAFVPPKRPGVPEVKDASWPRNAIDRFVLARLEGEGIAPSPDAEPATWLRRVFLDLTGLPPTTRELDEFLAAGRAGGWETARQSWVDRLLTTEPYRARYAERMATPWLDMARYADTIGIHTDNGRQMWLYRDWVIDAFGANMPFDRFVTEQLAGDLLPDATVEQRIASGFNRAHVITDEGGAIPEEYLVEYAVDRTVTAGEVFLGLTLGCARCHDHKFDPISQEDFYGLYAFFNSNDEPGLYSQTPDSNRAYEPFLAVPTEAQQRELAELAQRVAELEAELAVTRPEDEQAYAEFLEAVVADGGVTWADTEVTDARSRDGASMEALDDGSVRAAGANPVEDVHEFTVRTSATGLDALVLEVLPDAEHGDRIGRADNGNAVLDGLEAEAVSVTDPQQRRAIAFDWAWADYAQENGNYDITNVLDVTDTEGWAVGGHMRGGGRVALLLAREPFGFEGGTEVHVTLRYTNKWAQHAFARTRLHLGALSETTRRRLPAAASRWAVAGPFPEAEGADPAAIYDTAFGPETLETIDYGANFGFGNQYWRFDGALADGRPIPLADGRGTIYVGKTVYAPTERTVAVSLGSDDGFVLYVNGAAVAERRVDRGAAPDQDRAEIPLRAGANALVLKVVNTGGPSAYYYRRESADAELDGDLVAAVLPGDARAEELAQRLSTRWRVRYLPRYRETRTALEETTERIDEVNAAVPLAMVMNERDEPRPAFVLTRGRYDAPDESRPVTRAIPAALGALPGGAPRDRRGLAAWITAGDNPLTARVAVNRWWAMLLGRGLVETSEDFGRQGSWPSHPELLDWLAVELRDSGWDVQHLLRLIVTSRTYGQSSHARPELEEVDPHGHLLAAYPRRRLSAEQLRDQALYTSGLLVEQHGGPPVKPYQPPGLWREVAMPASNTRNFERGAGDDLWRRSVYTYWKRAAPPPAMLTLDAPTREFCTIRRPVTSTPLQALVLWNDEQFVEAGRALAQRVVTEERGDAAGVRELYRRCTAREADDQATGALLAALAEFRDRYRAAPEDAAQLLAVGEAPLPEDTDPAELAAWTMVAGAVLNLYETTTQR